MDSVVQAKNIVIEEEDDTSAIAAEPAISALHENMIKQLEAYVTDRQKKSDLYIGRRLLKSFSFFGSQDAYTKTKKIDAAKVLIDVLKGNDTSNKLSDPHTKALLDGRLGKIVKTLGKEELHQILNLNSQKSVIPSQ